MLKVLRTYDVASMAGLLGYAISVVSPYLFSKRSQHYANDLLEPFIRHKTLCAMDFRNKNILIIGDVHGCFEELQLLLRNVEKKTDKNVVKIFVGDMINKGPQSEEVLEYLIKEKDIHCVRGNHEQKVLRDYYAYNNEQAAPSDKRLWVQYLKKSYIDYIKNLPFTISIPTLNIIVVHAGLIPGVPLAKQEPNSMMNMRNLYWAEDDFHGRVLTATYRPNIGVSWATVWPGPEHVYFGHDAVRKLQLNAFSTGLDTGCVYGGELTAMLLHLNSKGDVIDKEMFHVKPREVYVPVVD